MKHKHNDKKDGKILTCLNCLNIKMQKVKCGPNLELDQCPECGGIWFDSQELYELTQLDEFYAKTLDNSNKRPIEKNRIRECPRCGVVLEAVKSSRIKDVKVDRCPDCKGLWIDRGELLKLLNLKK